MAVCYEELELKYSQDYLDKELKKYGASDVYPFHMPGHKRQPVWRSESEGSAACPDTNDVFYQASQIDITEISGFDNLHHPEGILAQAQDRMARVFGAERSFFLVNGSTSGLLAAISAAVEKGGKILIARNCHKAVYNAIYLRELSVEYVYPMQTTWGIQGSIAPEDIRQKLAEDSQIQAVLLTSPTYDGVVSDIETIAQIVHAHNIPLIVDEAHGAHFGFSEGFPKKALALGADVVIESLHKTLPAFTQSAALHMQGDRIKPENIQKFLGIYQSSSPSYLLMAGLDRCVRIMETQGTPLMKAYEKQLAGFYHRTKGLQYLKVLLPENTLAISAMGEKDISVNAGVWRKEPSKILIFCENAGMNGHQLARILLEEYGLELEMNAGHYVTALTSLMDTEEGFERLAAALKAIDEMIEEASASTTGEKRDVLSDEKENNWRQMIDMLYQPKEKQMEIGPATECEATTLPFAQAAGKVSVEFAYLYPPGIPFLAPGEVIPKNLPEIVEILSSKGYEIQGLEDLSGQRIKVASR